MYIIDGNNLAGKLGMLDKRTFNRELVEMVADYFMGKNKKVLVVFDGHGSMDFPVSLRGVDVHFAGDFPYARESADEKILAIIARGKRGESFILVSEDSELQAASKRTAKKSGVEIQIVKASFFAQSLTHGKNAEQVGDEKSLSPRDEEYLYEDLVKEWGENKR
jgi:predicted RNA-binding protein with PIN domain